MHLRLLASYLDHRAGSAVYMRALATHLAAAGHRVSVLCLGPEDVAPPQGVGEEDFAVLPPPRLAAPGLWRFDHLKAFRTAGRRIAALEWPRPDAVIASEHSMIRAHARLFSGIPWIYLPHAARPLVADEMGGFFPDPIQRAVNRRLYGRAQRFAWARADAVVRFSAQAVAAMADALGCEPRRAVVIPPAVDLPESWEPPRAEPPVRLLAVSRLVKGKNIDLLLEVLSHVDPAKPFHLDIVGAGPERARLEGIARALGIAARVTFHGASDNVSAHYAQADLVVVPSKRESLGLVQIEAMAHARPVLAFDPDAPGAELLGGRLIEHGVTGWLARDDEDFLRILHLLIWNPTPLRPAGRAARQRAQERHGWPQHVARWQALAEELVGA